MEAFDMLNLIDGDGGFRHIDVESEIV